MIAVQIDPERAWDQTLFAFRASTEAICEMAKSPDFRDMAVEDSGSIAEAVLAVNLMWSALQARKAA